MLGIKLQGNFLTRDDFLSILSVIFSKTLILDYCWFWDESKKSDDVIVQNCGTEAYFHPDYSCGTAAIRGNRQFREGEEHYWEVQMSSAVYGTDMVWFVLISRYFWFPVIRNTGVEILLSGNKGR